MLGYQLREASLIFARAVEQNASFFEGLKVLSAWLDLVNDQLQHVAPGGHGLTNATSAMHSYLNSSNIANPIRASVFARSAWAVETALRELFPCADDKANHAQMLADDIQALLDKHDTYTSEKSGVNAVPLLLAANSLHVRLIEFQETLNLVGRAIVDEHHFLGEQEAELLIVLPSTQDFSAFWGKLQMIDEIYRQLCLLTAESESANPLRIIKIESGSFAAWFAGAVGAIKAMGGILAFVQRNYTTEGRLTAIGGEHEDLWRIVQSAAKFKEAGFNVDATTESVQLSLNRLAEQTSRFVGSDQRILLNGKPVDKLDHVRISQGGDQTRRIGGTPPPQLGHDSTKDNGDGK